MRSEQEIFDELSSICSSPGYAHAISIFCFRDNVVGFKNEVSGNDLARLRGGSRLIRSEISTLIGLLVRNPVDYTIPDPSTLNDYLDKTEELLEELHESMASTWFKDITPELIASGTFNPFSNGEGLREPIFYCGESAYSFQYRDFSEKKYADDNEWLLENKGFTINHARDVVAAITQVQNDKLTATLNSVASIPITKWTMLPGFSFTIEDISSITRVPFDIIAIVLSHFTFPDNDRNSTFNALDDFNLANAMPILRIDAKSFVLFQQHSLVESLYESPFYWMGSDRKYAAKALQHRGRFTEAFARERLENVFGKDHVYANVTIPKTKSKTQGEIDVLVLFGGQAIVLQAKSKRLTIGARKGNDLQIKDDFRKAIQESYDQAKYCSEALLDTDCKIVDADGKQITLKWPIKKIYPVCTVSDHYPALSFQSQQFLKFKESEVITPPIVTDIFAIDVMAEMLNSPLRFLSYLDLRTRFHKKLMITHEYVALAYHLKRNLWVDDRNDLMFINDDYSADLDAAMTVRRDGLPGHDTPTGILSNLRETAIGRMISQIESEPHPSIIDFGMLLLELNEDTANELSHAMDHIVEQTNSDGLNHDLTVAFGNPATGITIHCNFLRSEDAKRKLLNHCRQRKYKLKAENWFGVIISPLDGSIINCVKLNYSWEYSLRMEDMVRNLPAGSLSLRSITSRSQKKRPGRNSSCPCGSGKKFKKCCLPLLGC